MEERRSGVGAGCRAEETVTRKEYSPGRVVTSAAKAGDARSAIIAAVNRCAIQNQSCSSRRRDWDRF
jgi:hypothetical protein